MSKWRVKKQKRRKSAAVQKRHELLPVVDCGALPPILLRLFCWSVPRGET